MNFDHQIDVISYDVKHRMDEGLVNSIRAKIKIDPRDLNTLMIVGRMIKDRMNAYSFDMEVLAYHDREWWQTQEIVFDFQIRGVLTEYAFKSNLSSVITDELSKLNGLIQINVGDMIKPRIARTDKVFTVVENLNTEFDSRKCEIKNAYFKVIDSCGIKHVHWSLVESVS